MAIFCGPLNLIFRAISPIFEAFCHYFLQQKYLLRLLKCELARYLIFLDISKSFDCCRLAIQWEIPLHTEESFKTQVRIKMKVCLEKCLTEMPNKHSESLEKWSPFLRFLIGRSLVESVCLMDGYMDRPV